MMLMLPVWSPQFENHYSEYFTCTTLFNPNDNNLMRLVEQITDYDYFIDEEAEYWEIK